MFKKSNKSRLLIIFLTVTLVPLLLMGIGVTFQFGHLEEQYHENILNHIRYANSSTEEWFNHKISILENVGQTFLFYQDIHLANIDDMNGHLDRYKNSSPGFYNIYIALESGELFDASDTRPDMDMRYRPWYINAKALDAVIISEPYDDIITGDRVVTISMPFKDYSGEFVGVLGGDLVFGEVAHIINEINMDEQAQQIVFDRQGNVMWSSEGSDLIEAVDLKNFENGKIVKLSYQGKNLVAVNEKLASIGWNVVTIADVNAFYTHINRMKYELALAIVLAITLMILSVIWISGKMAKPMLDLRDATREISQGRFGTKLKVIYRDELGEVMTAFNDMSSSLQQNHEDIRSQSKQLMETNEQLQEMNMELEASYEQLAATTEHLNESEQKYRILIENISDKVWVIDREGRITYINDVVETLLGYDKEALIGEKLSQIMCPLHDYNCDNSIVELMEQEDFNKKDLWMLAADRERRIILETNTKRIIHQGQLMAIQGLGRDVTEYVAIKNEIIKRNKELTLLHQISSSLTDTLSTVQTDTLLQCITDSIVEVMGVDVCTIRLLNEDKMLEFKNTSGPLSHLVYNKAIPIVAGDIGDAVIYKKMIKIDNYDERKSFPSYVQKIVAFQKIKYAVYLPLLIEDQVIGVMVIGSVKRIEETSYNILNSLSNHAAVAIEKARLYDNLKDSYLKTIKALATAVEVKDTYTRGHSTRVSQYALLIGRHYGLEQNSLEELETAGILHDIGKIGISDIILTKPGRLDHLEYQIIKQHTSIGSRILEPIGLSKEIIDSILLHHKRADLKGYPEEVVVKELPLYAKIIGVADAFDAMISNRSYKQSLSIEEARQELLRFSGTQFDPKIVEIMDYVVTHHSNEIEKIANI